MKRNFSDLDEKLKEKLNKSSSSLNSNNLNQSLSQSQSPLKNNKSKETEIEKPKKFVYLNQKVNIPSTFYDRVELIKELFGDEDITFVVLYAPSNRTTNVKQLGKYFKNKLHNILDIATGILFYFYKSVNIKKTIFDHQLYSTRKNSASKILNYINGEKEEIVRMKTSDEILLSGEITSSDEACLLYQDLCGYAGVKIDIVEGLLKKSDYKIGDSLVKHKWCVINCGVEKNYFIDPLLAVGEIDENGEYVKELKPFYFLTPPLFFLENHLPEDKKYQFMPRSLKVKEFTRIVVSPLTEVFYNYIYKFKITLENYKSPVIECKDSEIVIKFIVDGFEIKTELEYIINGKKLPENNCKITDNNLRSNYQCTVIFPTDGSYKMTILGKSTDTHDKQWQILLIYRINVKITNFITHDKPKKKNISPKKITMPNFRSMSPLPQFQSKTMKGEKKLSKCASDFGEKIKKKCYDNKDAHIYEPRSKILRIGQEARFKIRIKGAKCVVVLDGSNWNYLKKRDEGLFEGIVQIKTENIVVCAMRNNNMFTEVCEFLALKK